MAFDILPLCIGPTIGAMKHFFFALIFAVMCGLSVAAQAQVLRFAVIPEEPAAVAQQRFAPLLRYLETRGLTAVWIPMADMPSLIDAVASKRVDFAWMNGFAFLQARARMSGNLMPIAQRTEDTQFKSVILTHDADIQKLADIAGKNILFGPPTSASGHLMPRHFINAQVPALIAAGPAKYAASHEAVIYQLLEKKVDVGVVNEAVWKRLQAEGRLHLKSLQTLYTTPSFFDYCFAIPADRDPALVTALQNALIGLNPRSAEHAPILHALRATRLISSAPENYALLEAIAKESGLLK
jgi:phosphonate transport system substrate-binding protein